MRPSMALGLALLSSASSASPSSPQYNSRSLSGQAAPIHIPITRRAPVRTAEAFLAKARKMKAKHGKTSSSSSSSKAKRAGSVSMTNEDDSEFYGTISVGTPATDFNVILDTGSSDLLLATSPCTGCLTTTSLYTPSDSSTSVSSSTQFSITYGSGDAAGTLAEDTVSIGGYSVSNQVFAACTTLNEIVEGKISGLLGLGWESIASSKATPLVEALANNGSLPAQEFGFAFTTYPETTSANKVQAGGTLTIGGTDTSSYTGSINWVDIVQPAGYWQIPLEGIHVGGTDLAIASDAVVIDSGTSLIGAPASAVAAIYAQIPGSSAISLDGEAGYYSYGCDTSVNLTFTFGGVQYAIPSSNFNSGYADNQGSTCLGAIFELDSGSLPWIIGDSFLVGVYSAFRFSSPAAVGRLPSPPRAAERAPLLRAMLLPIALLLTLALPSPLLASPVYIKPSFDKIHLPLVRRNDGEGRDHSGEAALARASALITQKYGRPEGLQKRQGLTAVPMNNLYADAEYIVRLDIGTPPRPFEVIIDTGSVARTFVVATNIETDAASLQSDLWCTGCDTNTPLYHPASSSTSGSSSTPFSIVYGSGDAAGTLAQDTVSIGNYTVPKQIFAAVTNSTNVVSGQVTGILGAGWQALATSGATPILQALAEGGSWPEQSFSFAFTRFVNVASAYSNTEPGGILTLGGVNTSLFTGSMNYVPITDSGTYWLIPLQGITVGGSQVTTDNDPVAVDTGTSLIGGPAAQIAAIYALIPNSRPVQIQGQSGYYAYPCATEVNVAMTFGGVSYKINPLDFNAGVATNDGRTCLGAFFEIETSPRSPKWIVGATFLKNVYTSFRFSPSPAVGFASLSAAAADLNNVKVTFTGSASGSTSTSSTGSSSSGGTSAAPSMSGSVPRAFAALVLAAAVAFAA
ncbi:hypothetical protein RQP46_005916 [Phenoliferia psychrophenolica]